MNNNFTFLEEEQIFGDKALDIIKRYGTDAAITDFSILLGGYVSSNYYTNEGNTGMDRTGWWWTRTDDGANDARVVHFYGFSDNFYVNFRDGGARPALPYSSIQSICSNVVRDNFGIKEVEYGEYPQTIVDEEFSRELERAYNNGNIKVTGKTYTTDSVRLTDYNTSFNPRQHQEFEYYGRKYIRFVGDINGEGSILSDGRTIKAGQAYWVAVEPIKWLVDEKEDIALSKKLIFSGVQFQNTRNYKGVFDKTDVKEFMDKYFSKEILASKKAIDLSNINLSLLEEEQIFGDKALDIIKRYGTKAKITDLAVIRGGSLSGEGTGYYWTKDRYGSSTARVVRIDGSRYYIDVSLRTGGCRPALPYSSIQSICSNVVRDSNGIPTVICGEYPQYAVSKDLQQVLNSELDNNSRLKLVRSNCKLKKTLRTYTFDSRKYDDYNNGFSPEVYDEYEYQGKKYIRVKVNSRYRQTANWSCKDGDYVWMEVAPVEWIIDEKENIAIAKNILVAGIRYDDETKYDGNFENTEMKEYLSKYMVHDLFQNMERVYASVSNIDGVERSEALAERKNPYDFNFEDVSEEDIIRGAIESNVSVFLHGRSSEGKSARIKELDPDCEIIYMRNATPDSLNGKSVYNSDTNEMIDVPPTWYEKVKERCEKEPEKIHLIFFDELTNALPSIQGMAFNIVLDGEVNGKWKLPPNARIVAAGNDLNDSLAANQMAEPLFNRFAHVYIETTVDSWLKWASTPKEEYKRLDYVGKEEGPKIHPAIYAFVAYRSYSGKDVLRTPYTGDKPNADPRKWEMASKVLYKTKKPEMLRALVGEDVTRDFVEFTKQQVITVEDVINHNYTENDLEMNTAQKFATAVGLSSVDEEHLEEAREFMKKLGAEPRAAFESMWSHGDKKRLEFIAELQMSDNMKQGGIRR